MHVGEPAEASHSAGGIVLALAIPFIFLHVDYQPHVAVAIGGTNVKVTAADVALLVVAVAAVVSAVREGAEPLRHGKPAWLAATALLAWIGVTTVRAGAATDGYAFADHAVSALKFAEYAVLAAAVPLLLRRAPDVRLFLRSLVGWGAVACLVGLAQFFGADIFEAWRPGRRQGSFLGHHDLAALALCSLGVAFAAILAGRDRSSRVAAVSAGVGSVGTILSGAVAAVGGLLLAAPVAVLVAWRPFRPGLKRAAFVGAVVAVCAVGVTSLRGGELDSFLRYLGVSSREQQSGVESYSHRTVLAYIGLRIFLDHPVLGVGWQGSGDVASFLPYVPDAKRRFPEVAEEAFPAAGRAWGVQDAYVQALADMGFLGLIAFLAPFAAGSWLAVRAVRRAAGPPAELGLVALVIVLGTLGIWSAEGLVAGIPLDAVTWIGIGLAVAATAAGRDNVDV
jgi:O-antigen ligase